MTLRTTLAPTKYDVNRDSVPKIMAKWCGGLYRGISRAAYHDEIVT